MQPRNGCLMLLVNWLITSFAIYAAAELLPGIKVDNFWDTVKVAFALGIINAILKPILMVISFPFIVVTFGLFLVIINAVALSVADSFVIGFEIDNFWWAIGGSLIISLVSYVLNFPGTKGE